MTIDFAHYAGREQAFVKHTFLDKYIPALIGIVCSTFNEFVYIDGFAGPWKSVAGEAFEDTSFGIALKHMTEQRKFYAARGRPIRMRAYLVEKDEDSFLQLQQTIAHFPDVDVIPLNGMMEDHVADIASLIPSTAFSFTLIDPKGFPDIAALMPLLKRRNAEALVNFMFDFANRFAGTDLIPKLEAWLSASGKVDWRDEIKSVSGKARERLYEELAVEALRATPGYRYAPVITVDKVLHDRPLYKLIFLTRHTKGLEVFRNCEAMALEVQAKARSASKALWRDQNSVMGDFFSDGSDAIPNDRSLQDIRRGQERATHRLIVCLTLAGSKGMSWADLWPTILADYSVTRSWLGRQVNQIRKSGEISAPGWPNERMQIPKEDQLLFWAGKIG